MAEMLQKKDRRTKYCGEFTKEDIGKTVCALGWAAKTRDLGSLLFIDLRDRTGIVQLAFDTETPSELIEKAKKTRTEYVLAAHGVVRARGEGAVNKTMATGEIEIYVTEFRIISAAQTTPFEILDDSNVRDDLALKYRYLDLRRQVLTKNILMRHEIALAAREYFYKNGFIEIETPMMIKPTPEGARDYVVPSRIHHGHFYALPQSPQMYKQLLMVAGFDRYIQLARCFRDEDLRADRQPEFTQIDLEMSFVDQNDIMDMIEGFVTYLFKKVLNKDVQGPLVRMTFADAMNRFGSDKPDTRYGMEIQNISEVVKNSAFSVFSSTVQSGGSVRAIVAENSSEKLSRKEIDKLTEHAKGIGAKGLAYIRWVEDEPSCSFAKLLGEGELDAIVSALNMKKGDCALIIADKDKVTLPVLGALRQIVARKLDMIPDDKYNFLWITEFPFFEWDEESGTWVAMHHPFTMPLPECLPYIDTDPASVRATSYDLVLNGTELLSGSMRITDVELQQKMFESLGLSQEEIEAKFGFLVEAYKYGAPPHGGAAIGLDRLSMILCHADSLRDVLAFPKVQNASEPMSGAPAIADEKALKELALALTDVEE
jgi:aspartyl-tRNA synthetase